MTHTYQLTGMTCSSCEAKIKSTLIALPGINSVEVSKEKSTATITMEKHILLNVLQEAVKKAGDKYQINTSELSEISEQAKSWFATYKPILVIFLYITVISSVVVFSFNLHWHGFMNLFMAQFFLVFSFFKMLDLKGFADSYSMYDIVAKRIKAYGFIYPFIEFGLGIAFITGFNPIITNLATLVVMGISIIGVLQSVLNKKKIKCACLGAVFNLPMSTVTIIEDALMIVMSATMLLAI